ncbi:MAG: pyridoxine 5'-phosphate synthase [Prolixibacteraceae bacterium]|jgi:pyridoxine 5-phosphate synthase|nr:pyridoxine 5'-phosphate synthase [Prolixibacteraceae bacterium]MBT6004233.1 pyridoxine 5'-phosphate synthase [Prolixibacteraceae bacterium]MBT6766520.1 pyridoxine 5'-phosphate synthase [Prolixibacteraceae bacterium]MBT6997902.1 pyridoxine 5'-phosphate synthase [Prolixibacteraceae bacterium]MBT7395622.1 pyridoxine 5'-phosphate synthase [Prolixibacteraceae bacterium]
MTRLSVNINKIATLRNSRGGNKPSVKDAAINCQNFGAQGITIHPRPDERHITRKDVYELKPLITTEFNIEGYPSEDFLKMVIEVKADQVTLVPDSHNQLTSDHGWDTWKNLNFLKEVISRLQENGIRTSIFVDPNPIAIEGASEIKTDRIELYTEPYANLYHINRSKAIEPFIEAAKVAVTLGIDVNAGHDLNLENLNYMFKKIPDLKEVSIGHALVADALYIGLENSVRKYLNCLK